MGNEKDEAVDGAKIAAAILNAMDDSNKSRIVQAIQKADPAISIKIEENLVRFDDLTDVTSAGIQKLIKEIPHDDLVLSLKVAPEPVKQALYANMSERKRALVMEDLNSLSPVPASDVEKAKKRIIQKLDELRSQGLVTTQSKKDIWV